MSGPTNGSGTDGAAAKPAVQLTQRELDVWRLLSAGMTPREVAAELRLGVKTVECYREHLRIKLGIPAHFPARLVVLGIECGLVDLNRREALAGIHRLEAWEQLARVNAEIFGGAPAREAKP